MPSKNLNYLIFQRKKIEKKKDYSLQQMGIHILNINMNNESNKLKTNPDITTIIIKFLNGLSRL